VAHLTVSLAAPVTDRLMVVPEIEYPAFQLALSALMVLMVLPTCVTVPPMFLNVPSILIVAEPIVGDVRRATISAHNEYVVDAVDAVYPRSTVVVASVVVTELIKRFWTKVPTVIVAEAAVVDALLIDS
jgi:hypothetical protein